jgi:hypothetical protein
LSNYSAFKTVSILTSSWPSDLFYASLRFIGQSHLIVLHFLQPTPPIFSIKSLPYITNDYVSFGDIIPIYYAMALAVIKLSPVTILTVIPALLHLRIA